MIGVLCCRGFAQSHHDAVAAHDAPAAAHGAGAGTEVRKSPFEVEALLKAGNIRFMQDAPSYPHQGYNRRHETSAAGQYPVATVLTCSDSRVPPELIFDQGIGDLFVIRVAGNVADAVEVATVEYGAGHLGTPLIMVLGHTKCGAVTAVATHAHVGGNLPSLVDNIVPAVAATEKQHPEIKGDELIYKSIKRNIWQTVEDIFKSSAEIRELARQGKVKVVGALYDIESGEVENLGVYLNQDNLLRKYK